MQLCIVSVAPEMLKGTGHGKAVDMWGLGILLYELTVGLPPFYSKVIREMYDSILYGELKFPPFLTDECQNLIEMVRLLCECFMLYRL